jgi:hypothetical protein
MPTSDQRYSAQRRHVPASDFDKARRCSTFLSKPAVEPGVMANNNKQLFRYPNPSHQAAVPASSEQDAVYEDVIFNSRETDDG